SQEVLQWTHRRRKPDRPSEPDVSSRRASNHPLEPKLDTSPSCLRASVPSSLFLLPVSQRRSSDQLPRPRSEPHAVRTVLTLFPSFPVILTLAPASPLPTRPESRNLAAQRRVAAATAIHMASPNNVRITIIGQTAAPRARKQREPSRAGATQPKNSSPA